MAITKTSKNHFLQQFEQHLSNILTWDNQSSLSVEPNLFAAARHLCLAKGGKRARPKLVHFFATSLELEQKVVFDIAVTAEFIHNASLLHDDVIDSGELRRGQPTVNVVWDNITAVLAGDILLSESIKILSNCPRIVANEALELVSTMTRATMMEAHIRNHTDVTIPQWEYICDGKTSSMFRWCGRAVGHLAKDPQATDAFDKFGYHFGLAFQLADDVLDFKYDDSGKTPFADLRNKNPNYPLVLACQQSSSFKADLEKYWAKDIINEQQTEEIGLSLLSSGVLDDCIDRIQREVDLSIEALDHFVERPGCQEIALWALAMCQRFQTMESA